MISNNNKDKDQTSKPGSQNKEDEVEEEDDLSLPQYDLSDNEPDPSSSQ